MAEKSPKKFFKKPLKPHGTGILRFQVLNCLFEAGVPIRVFDIAARLRKKGIRHSLPTIYQAVYEIPMALDNIELNSVTIYGKGFGRAEAYSVSFIKKSTDSTDEHHEPVRR